MRPTKVSVVISTYNRVGTIKAAIDSVLAQTFPASEIIIVDSCSTDKTHEILESYGSKIITISTKRLGISNARNVGVLAAKGDYIAFLDSDDMFLPRKLEFQLEAMDSFFMSFTAFSRVGEDGLALADVEKQNLPIGMVYPDLLFIRSNCIHTSTVVVDRRVFDIVGLFNTSMNICEDLDLWRRIGRKFPVLPVRFPLSIIRTRKYNSFALGEYQKARRVYYETAFLDDPHIKKLKPELYEEMCLNYAKTAYAQRRLWLGIGLILQGLAWKLIGNI